MPALAETTEAPTHAQVAIKEAGLYIEDTDSDSGDSSPSDSTEPEKMLWSDAAECLELMPLGVPAGEMRTFRLSNSMGKTVRVEDEAGNIMLMGTGKFRPLGYNFSFTDNEGSPVFQVVSRELHRQDRYEWQLPDGTVLATATKGYVQKRTSLHIHVGGAIDQPYVLKCKSTKVFGGEFCVTNPAGLLLGYVKRDTKEGMVKKQSFSIVVGPGVDPYLMVVLALICNCVTNERPRLFWGALATGIIAI